MRGMTGMKVLPTLLLAVAISPVGFAAGQSQPPRIEIVVDQTCLIAPESNPAVLGDHTDSFRDPVICHLESNLSSHHIEEQTKDGERSRSLVRIREHEFLLQNVTDAPAVFVVRQDVPEDWTVDSDPQPVAMDGSTAVFRVQAEPGQIVRLHVGMRNAVPMADNGR
jgi:hypothetical protein